MLANWQELEAHFKDTVVIGNGGSIAVDKRFDYSSILSAARERGFITPQLSKIFDHLKTSDFEAVLRVLSQAAFVNSALAINSPAVQDAYVTVREALIGTLRGVHLPHSAVKGEYLSNIANFLKNFRTVFSLNYDLIVYWAMMGANKKRRNYFVDCFKGGSFDSIWPEKAERTRVFYPHGHLMLASGVMGEEVKVSASDQSLLEKVFAYWTSEYFSPIFVSEGDSDHKVKAIRRSGYLTAVYEDALPEEKESLVVYGWSMGDNDSHILEQLRHSGIKRCAVSVRREKYSEEIRARWRHILTESLRNERLDTVFFDSASAGAWIYPVKSSSR